MKPANRGPIYAAALYPQLAEIARKHGYALAVHGSLARDFDLIAVPWIDYPNPAQVVVDEIVSTFDIKEAPGNPFKKDHGRWVWTLCVGFGDCFLDLSFMPTKRDEVINFQDVTILPTEVLQVLLTEVHERPSRAYERIAYWLSNKEQPKLVCSENEISVVSLTDSPIDPNCGVNK